MPKKLLTESRNETDAALAPIERVAIMVREMIAVIKRTFVLDFGLTGGQGWGAIGIDSVVFFDIIFSSPVIQG